LLIRKVYGRDQIRYLRCRCCQQEFSERKNTALWNSKIPEAKAVSVAEHPSTSSGQALADGCGIKSTARLVKVDPSTVRRLNGKVGDTGSNIMNRKCKMGWLANCKRMNDTALWVISSNQPGKQN